jgi:hypothetical protein
VPLDRLLAPAHGVGSVEEGTFLLRNRGGPSTREMTVERAYHGDGEVDDQHTDAAQRRGVHANHLRSRFGPPRVLPGPKEYLS